MPAKRVRFGTGITQREDVVIDAEDATKKDVREWGEATEASNRYRREGGHIAHIETRARQILAQAEGSVAEQSGEWYAQEALRCLDLMRRFDARGDTTEALNRAVALGALWKEAEMKFQWERFALVGEKVVDSGNNSGYGVTAAEARDALQ